MTPQDTPPPLDLEAMRIWFGTYQRTSLTREYGLSLIAEVERLRGVDQGNGVREALARALQQWKSYAEEREDYDITKDHDPEAIIYRECLAALGYAEARGDRGWDSV